MNELNPWYVTGLVDGEGCFSFCLNTENKKRKGGFISKYTYWVTTFSINLRMDEIATLNRVKEFFGCGSSGVTKSTKLNAGKFSGTAYFHVKSRVDLVTKIIPHFEKFPLQANKYMSYSYWKEAVTILHNADMQRKTRFSSQNITTEQNTHLLEIKQKIADSQSEGHRTISMRTVLSKKLGKEIDRY